MWASMEPIAREIAFRDRDTKDFVVASCIYGRFKHAIVAEAWEALILAKVGEKTGEYDKPRIARAIEAYDGLWKQWNAFAAAEPMCPTLYHDYGFAGRPGVGAAINKLRGLVA
jgi:hypothetical protein